MAKHKADTNNYRASKYQSKQKQAQPNQNQNCPLEKQNNFLTPKNSYGLKQTAINFVKGIQRSEIQKGNKPKHLRKVSTDNLFAINLQRQQACKLQSPRGEMQNIQLNKYDEQKHISFEGIHEKQSNKVDNPYHHSKFKKELDTYKLTYDEAPSSKRGKIIQIRESLTKSYKGQ